MRERKRHHQIKPEIARLSCRSLELSVDTQDVYLGSGTAERSIGHSRTRSVRWMCQHPSHMREPAHWKHQQQLCKQRDWISGRHRKDPRGLPTPNHHCGGRSFSCGVWTASSSSIALSLHAVAEKPAPTLADICRHRSCSYSCIALRNRSICGRERVSRVVQQNLRGRVGDGSVSPPPINS